MKKFVLLVVLAVSVMIVSILAAANDNPVEEQKIGKGLLLRLNSDEMTSVIVQFNEVPVQAQQAMLKSNACNIKYVPRRMNLLIADCPGKRIGQISADNDVKFVYEDEILGLTLVDTVPQISADDAQALGYNGTGINVSVMDSGINKTHPALMIS